MAVSLCRVVMSQQVVRNINRKRQQPASPTKPLLLQRQTAMPLENLVEFQSATDYQRQPNGQAVVLSEVRVN